MTPDNVFDSSKFPVLTTSFGDLFRQLALEEISFAVISSDEQIAHIRSMCESLLPADDKRQRLDECRDGRVRISFT